MALGVTPSAHPCPWRRGAINRQAKPEVDDTTSSGSALAAP
jgi:hypothetical protein